MIPPVPRMRRSQWAKVLLSFTWSFMEPRHIVIERGSLKRLNVYSDRDTDRGRRRESERAIKWAGQLLHPSLTHPQTQTHNPSQALISF